MTPTRVTVALAASVLAPFAFALAFGVFAGAPRARRPLAVAYPIVILALNALLLEGFLAGGKIPGWGSLKMTRYGFPVLLILGLVSGAIVLYRGARATDHYSGLLLVGIAAGTGFGYLAVLSTSMLGFAICWEGATACAVIGLAAHGSSGFRSRLLSFAPWLAADLVFLVGVVMARSVLKEGALLISPPLIHGSEGQVEFIMVLLLISAALRLGLFPLSWRRRDLVSRCEGAWSAFFLGGLNVLVTGYFLLVTSALIARFVAADWSIVLVLIGALSVIAGPVLAAGSGEVPGYLSGVLTMVGGLLFLCAGLFSRSAVEAFLFVLLCAPIALSALIAAIGKPSGLRSVRSSPVLAAGVVLAIFSVCALPPADGFVSRALVALACFDKGLADPWFALLAALMLASAAVMIFATFKMMHALPPPGVPPIRPDPERLSLVIGAMAVLAIAIGVIPGPLIRNVIEPASRAIFHPGFSGPGVVFRATARPVADALGVYLRWSESAAAFILACLLAAAASRCLRRGAQSVEESEISDS